MSQPAHAQVILDDLPRPDGVEGYVWGVDPRKAGGSVMVSHVFADMGGDDGLLPLCQSGWGIFTKRGAVQSAFTQPGRLCKACEKRLAGEATPVPYKPRKAK